MLKDPSHSTIFPGGDLVVMLLVELSKVALGSFFCSEFLLDLWETSTNQKKKEKRRGHDIKQMGHEYINNKANGQVFPGSTLNTLLHLISMYTHLYKL